MAITQMVGKAGRVQVPDDQVEAYKRRGYTVLNVEPVKATTKKSKRKKKAAVAETVADSDK